MLIIKLKLTGGIQVYVVQTKDETSIKEYNLPVKKMVSGEW